MFYLGNNLSKFLKLYSMCQALNRALPINGGWGERFHHNAMIQSKGHVAFTSATQYLTSSYHWELPTS